MPEGIESAVLGDEVAVLRQGPFGDNDDRRIARLESRLDPADDLVDGERNFGDQDAVRAAGHARMQCDPARMAAHDFANQYAVMRLGGGVQSIDGLGCDSDGRVKAEREIRAAQVVVDGLRYADDRKTMLGECGRHPEGVFSADGHKRIDAERGQGFLDALDTALNLDRVGTRRAQDGSTARKDAAHLRNSQFHGQAFERAFPTVAKTHELVAVLGHTTSHDCADHCIEAGAVSATGEHANAHEGSLPKVSPI